MTDAWFLLAAVAVVGSVIRHYWQRDIAARLDAEKRAEIAEALLEQSRNLREWEAAEAAERLREVTAIALALDLEVRTS